MNTSDAYICGICTGILILAVAIFICIPSPKQSINKFGLEHGFAHYDQKTGVLVRDSLKVSGDTIFITRN